MPTITIQVGQCGNQLGEALWELCSLQRGGADARSTHACDEFWEGTCPRLVAVDTEAKVGLTPWALPWSMRGDGQRCRLSWPFLSSC